MKIVRAILLGFIALIILVSCQSRKIVEIDVTRVGEISPVVTAIVTREIEASREVGTADIETGQEQIASLERGDSIVETHLDPPIDANPGMRGEGIQLTFIFWQAPSNQMPYLATGGSERASAAIVLEPLAGYNRIGEIYPILVDEVPTLANGGVSNDLMSITWTLKEELLWSDGTAVTSEDIVFTYEFCSHPDSGCTSAGNYSNIESVVAIDEHSAVVTFFEPTLFPYRPFVGSGNVLIQKAQWQVCMGSAAASCLEESFFPIGTGPFVVTDFRPHEAALYEMNPYYRGQPYKPFFASVFIKGGGDAESAARAVLENGESHYSWNLQVAAEVLVQMELAGLGHVSTAYGTQLERLMLNFTNSSPDLPLEHRSEYLGGSNPHPTLQHIEVRQAMSMAIDRTILTTFGDAPLAQPTCNFIPNPPAFSSPNNTCNQDIAGANALLDEAGFIDSDGDGTREADGTPLRFLFQTSTNAIRQGYQAFIKQWWAEIGIDTELRNIDSAIFFGNDPSDDDSVGKFYADVEMYADSALGVDFGSYLASFLCRNINGAANDWRGGNVSRYCNVAFDALLDEYNREADPARRQDLVIAMNDHLVQNYVVLPLTNRAVVVGCSVAVIGCRVNAWDADLHNVADWIAAEP